MRPTRQQTGFTLIEMLVALALMSLIGVIMIASLEIGGHSWQRVQRIAQDSDETAEAQTILRTYLGHLCPGNAQMDRTGGLVSEDSRLRFSSISPRARSDGMREYQLDVDSGRLRLRSRLAGAAGWSEEILLTGVASVTWKFWSAADKPGWSEQWTDRNHVPRLVSLQVSFPSGDRRHWPPLYIEPRVDTSADCEFDVVSRQCRSET